MIYILIGFICILIGFIIGILFIKKNKAGSILIYKSEEDKEPYLFCKLNHDISWLIKHKSVLMNIDDKTVSRE